MGVDLFSQNARSLERDDSTSSKLQVFSRLRIPSPPGPLVFDDKLPKPAYEEVFAALKSTLNDFKELFHDVSCVGFSQTKLPVNLVDNVIFRQRHDLNSFRVERQGLLRGNI